MDRNIVENLNISVMQMSVAHLLDDTLRDTSTPLFRIITWSSLRIFIVACLHIFMQMSHAHLFSYSQILSNYDNYVPQKIIYSPSITLIQAGGDEYQWNSVFRCWVSGTYQIMTAGGMVLLWIVERIALIGKPCIAYARRTSELGFLQHCSN